MGKDSIVTCLDAVTFSVNVVGENNNDVQNAFKEIEDNLRHIKIDKVKREESVVLGCQQKKVNNNTATRKIKNNRKMLKKRTKAT